MNDPSDIWLYDQTELWLGVTFHFWGNYKDRERRFVVVSGQTYEVMMGVWKGEKKTQIEMEKD